MQIHEGSKQMNIYIQIFYYILKHHTYLFNNSPEYLSISRILLSKEEARRHWPSLVNDTLVIDSPIQSSVSLPRRKSYSLKYPSTDLNEITRGNVA